ncbi:uncharacterized protein NECHADRAFT_79724 [Fusarium vanettenii 77-13-4]|uniref:Heterokaryon incompatibility domain-containing protein n=1 Tax=Fusarium vanettenii (strain ATCC MYA-4622 / CBS 123669 / FGSC 9596 / NRRL 45880 / 77-13-4) TaxID=660122 RepID=C7Z8A9_FUSV7|nr:uncharacterized protein NECHADRAFT_79724 [Fusarium vanettenii 77-13-4]EEU39837.1 hypothetical protein NECHADRAFT_79724 [Fusarium vanettenii 77-13-4]
MCYHDLVRFCCGHRVWSKKQRPCDDSLAGGECQEKRIRRHVYVRTNDRCLPCEIDREPSWLDPIRGGLPNRAATSLTAPNETLSVQDPRHISDDVPPPNDDFLQEAWVPGLALLATATEIVLQLESQMKRFEEDRQKLTRRVLEAMKNPEDPDRKRDLPASNRSRPSKAILRTTEGSGSPYSRLNLKARQIRLLELRPTKNPKDLTLSFLCMELRNCPSYTALSYTWGDEEATRNISIEGGGAINIRENLWSFFSLQGSLISGSTFFWIDAVCINQSNVHERNHQVSMMKEIYVNASKVFIWLGPEGDNSDLAMDFIATKGRRGLRRRGPGFHPIWPRHVGKALNDLCERAYWRRMWIIQEIVHADSITVWCGTKSFRWHVFESLYLTLKTLEETSWFPHHPHAIRVLQSSAFTMVWQRAHWRHPETPSPRLQVLIDIFRDWQCTDIRDKVFALVSMASDETAIVPDYSMSTLNVYRAVQDKHDGEKHQFYNMLSQILAIPQNELMFDGDMVEYKRHPPETLVLRALFGDHLYNDGAV